MFHREPPFQNGQEGPNTLAARQQLEAYQPGLIDRLFNRDETNKLKLYEEIEKVKVMDTQLMDGWKRMHDVAGRMLNRDIDTILK